MSRWSVASKKSWISRGGAYARPRFWGHFHWANNRSLDWWKPSMWTFLPTLISPPLPLLQVPPALARFLLWRVADIWFCHRKPCTESSSALPHSQWESWCLCPVNLGGYVSRNGAAGRRGRMQQAPLLLRGTWPQPLTTPCQRSRKNRGHAFAIDEQETFFFVNRLFWKTSFLMPQGGIMCMWPSWPVPLQYQ